MSKKRKHAGNKIGNQEEALAALNNFIDHGIFSEDILGEPVDSDQDFDELVQTGLELKMNHQSDSVESDDVVESPVSSNSTSECKSGQKMCDIVGISITHISSGCFNLLKMSDGIKDITFDLDLINQKDIEVDDDKVCGYAMAFLSFILPAFHPQRIGSKSYSGKYGEKSRAIVDFNSDKFEFYELSDLLLGYYVSDKSLDEFTNLCVELNSQGTLIDLFKKVSETLLSDGFNHMQLGGKIGVMGTLKPLVDMSEKFMETFINDEETVIDESKSSDKMYDALSRVSVLPASYYEEIDSFFSLFGYEDDDEDIDDEDDDDDEEELPESNTDVVQHMTEMMQYAISTDEGFDDSSSDGLLDDVDGAEEVKVEIKSTEGDGVEANVSVAKSEPIVIDSDTDFVVRRR